MRLTKLELNGFKSFADQTELQFDNGVTTIVGPNGCGKSNISDAVRWVLGEQRARALRGSKMEEVIFQGSSARRPVNIAEVSLYFENDDGVLDVPYREVVITRRLSRSGESEYLLNKASCRLRDIHDLLRGTGLGADAGVVIESKMIDALLSDRPDERRELFEEAAGIGLYRDRKHSTERRLEETALDLARLDDLIAEVQSQVRSLARQRKKTERHEELSARRFTVETALAAREMAAWKGELTELETRMADLKQTAPAADAAVTTAERDRDRVHGVRAAAEGQREELAKLVAAERDATFELHREIAVAEERQQNAVARRVRAEEEKREGGAIAERISTDRTRAADERSALEARLRAAAEALQSCVGEEEDARGALAEARATLEVEERRTRELEDETHRLSRDRAAAERELGELDGRLEAITTEESALRDTSDGVGREAEEVARAVTVAQQRMDEAGGAVNDAQMAVLGAREREAEARGDLHRAEEELASVNVRLSALETLETERAGLAPAAAQLLADRAQFGKDAIVGPLSDFISADTEAAGTVERYLGSMLHAVVVRDAAAVAAIREWHARAAPGALLLLPLDAVFDADSSAGDLTGVVRPSPAAARWVSALLGRVRSLDDGAAFVDSRGAVWLPGSTAGPGPLRRRAELGELASRRDTLATAMERASVRFTEAREAAAAADAAAAAASERLASQTRATRQVEDHRSETTRRLQRAQRDLQEASLARERVEARRAELRARMIAADAEMQRGAEAAAERERTVAAARAAAVAAERKQEESRDRRTAAQVQKAQIDAQLQVAVDRERNLDRELEGASVRLASLSTELSTLADADARLAEQIEHWKLDLETRTATLHDAETRLSNAGLAVRGADEALQEAERALDDARHRASALHEERYTVEVRYTELSGRRAAIRERLEAEWRRPLEDLLAEAGELEADDDALRAEAKELREQLDALGPVNPMAVEEHDEELKRLEFLTGQRDDLAAAKVSLHKAIKEIDDTAREMFVSAFVKVRENFRQIFVTLFGGGECDLRLELPETPLEGDIEIHASPRGKKTQRIHMLSTGERSLVALSLLFGIFLTKPSPFCVLDEVDAPLDENNIGRFVKMLTEFKRNTQFIVITHNPRTTTEAADSVYGVTMQEPGVSSMVSVQLRRRSVDDAIGGRPADVTGASAA